MNMAEWIAAKRDGERLNDDAIAAIVAGYTAGTIPEYQMAALAMAIFFSGMDSQEIVCLTREILDSGDRFHWSGDQERPVVDKHSTGGIGDKISIVLAPLLAAAGFRVPMISGRGLGNTGGTLDKLESIPGFRVNLSMQQISAQVEQLGCVIAGASEQIAPADRRLYALRDVTATVPSIPLITASILGKKLAEHPQALVLDVKCGSGAFMHSRRDAVHLARSLVSVASEMGVATRARITDMNQPLGRMVGNANEINESVAVLTGGGPDDVRSLTLDLAADLFELSGRSTDRQTTRQQLAELISSGQAMQRFQDMVAAQGGRWDGPLPLAPQHTIVAATGGWLASVDSDRLGWSIIEMGGGRKVLGDGLDHSTGLEMLARIGDRVETGQPVIRVFCPAHRLGDIEKMVTGALHLTDDPVQPPALMLEAITHQPMEKRH